MKKNKLISIIICFSLIFTICNPVYSEENDTTPKPYDNSEMPQGLKDLRRFEIITLGALPFVTLDTTLIWSGVRWSEHNFDMAYIPNPFMTTEGGFTQDDQIGVLLTSLSICVGIGLTDFVVNLIKRGNKKREAERINNSITIIPVEEDPDAVSILIENDDEVEVIENEGTE